MATYRIIDEAVYRVEADSPQEAWDKYWSGVTDGVPLETASDGDLYMLDEHGDRQPPSA